MKPQWDEYYKSMNDVMLCGSVWRSLRGKGREGEERRRSAGREKTLVLGLHNTHRCSLREEGGRGREKMKEERREVRHIFKKSGLDSV